jgi:hypothetical protein
LPHDDPQREGGAVRSTGQLFRWGLTSLLLVPVALVGSFVASGTPVLLWVALALILLGGVLNAAAVVRGIRRIGSGGIMTSLDGMTPADRTAPAGASDPIVPQQRIIFPDGDDASPTHRRLRRRVGLAAAVALIGLVAVGVVTLTVAQPLAIGQGVLTLDEVYAAWWTPSRIAFSVSVTIWVILSLAGVVGVALVAMLPSPSADQLVSWQRMLALACIVGSAIIVASLAPYFAMTATLPDDLLGAIGPTQSAASLAYGLTGVALSAAAILLTVPDWRRAAR